MASLIGMVARFRGRGRRARAGRSPLRRRPACEGLEGRALLSGLGTDYTLMGGEWDNARPVSFSFAPDGLPWDEGTNVLNATLDAEYGGTSWRDLVARALQTWAASADLDFVPSGDGDFGFNAPGAAQGDSRFGDIRIGGYDTGKARTIAQTYGPPPNGQTAGGEVEINTAFDLGPGARHDLQTVLLHELGHSLGLGESPQTSAAMYSFYSGIRRDLAPADVAGIQSLYGPRTPDAYQSRGLGTSPESAIDLTPRLDATSRAELGGLKLVKIGDVEYFSVEAPAVDGATLEVVARASGLSLLSPKVTVVDASTGEAIAEAAAASEYGNTISVTIPGARAGRRYLIAVTGATADVFAVGSYAVRTAFIGGSPIAPAPVPAPAPVSVPVAVAPTPTPPVAPPTPAAPAILPDRFAPNDSFATASELGPLGQTIVNDLTIPSGSGVRVFTFEVARAGGVLVASGGTTILVADWMGRPVASGSGLIGFTAPVTGSRYFLVFLSADAAPVASFGFAIATIPAPPVAIPPVFAAPTPTPALTPTPARPQRTRPKARATSAGGR